MWWALFLAKQSPHPHSALAEGTRRFPPVTLITRFRSRPQDELENHGCAPYTMTTQLRETAARKSIKFTGISSKAVQEIEGGAAAASWKPFWRKHSPTGLFSPHLPSPLYISDLLHSSFPPLFPSSYPFSLLLYFPSSFLIFPTLLPPAPSFLRSILFCRIPSSPSPSPPFASPELLISLFFPLFG